MGTVILVMEVYLTIVYLAIPLMFCFKANAYLNALQDIKTLHLFVKVIF